MRDDFEKWYLHVVRGHPNNLTKDEGGGYKYLGAMFLSWEAATMIEREACAKACEDVYEGTTDGEMESYHIAARDCADAIRERSNA